MSRKPPLSEEDKDLFRAAVTGTKPIVQKTVSHDIKKPVKVTRKHQEPDEKQLFHCLDHHEQVESEESLLYHVQDIDKKLVRKLQKGQYNVDAYIDLHGLTANEANEAFSKFIKQCRMRHHRCLLIIHGKGLKTAGKHPVLKNKINSWLRQIPELMAFCSAKPKDGGLGATYVLLRRNFAKYDD